MRLKKTDIIISVLMCMFTLITGCSDEKREYFTNQFGSDRVMRIAIRIPSTIIPSKTIKSGQTVVESQVNELQVLVFENGLYSYKAPIEGLTQIDNLATFSARIRSNNVSTTFFILANNNALVDANEPAVGTPIDNVRSQFSLAYAASGIKGNAAFWGSYTFSSGISNTPLEITNPISLLRAMSRVDVHVAPTAAVNFTLETVQVFRAADRMQIIPNSPNTELSVTSPSIPVGTLFNVNTNVINVTSPILSESQVYLPESTAPTINNQVSQATCIVIGGRYKNSATTRYYRLDFNPDIEGYPLGQILRNSRYVFTISEVNSNGYDTPEQAASNGSSGADVQLLLWNDNDTNHIFVDQSDFFALSDIDLALSGFINNSTQVIVFSSVPNYLMRFVSPTVSAWSTSISNTDFRVSQINGGNGLEIIALRDNPANGQIRESIVEISANGLQNIRIKIGQLPRMSIQWSMHNVTTIGDTTTELNARGLLYQWNTSVGWGDMDTRAPTGWPTSIVNRFPMWANPCPPGWRLPMEVEFRELLAEYPGRREDRSTNPLIGEWFGHTQAEANAASFSNPGNCIFFPYSGRRQDNGTTVAENKINGFYWTKDVTLNANNEVAQINMFRLGQQFVTGVHTQNINREALAIRCVR